MFESILNRKEYKVRALAGEPSFFPKKFDGEAIEYFAVKVLHPLEYSQETLHDIHNFHCCAMAEFFCFDEGVEAVVDNYHHGSYQTDAQAWMDSARKSYLFALRNCASENITKAQWQRAEMTFDRVAEALLSLVTQK